MIDNLYIKWQFVDNYSGCPVLGTWYRVLGIGYWVLGIGYWVLDD